MRDVEWGDQSPAVSWEHDGRHVRLELRRPPRSVTVLPERGRIVVVEGFDWPDVPDDGNAVVYDLAGTVVTRLRLPAELRPVAIDHVFVGSRGIEAVLHSVRGDFHATPDLDTGDLGGLAGWR